MNNLRQFRFVAMQKLVRPGSESPKWPFSVLVGEGDGIRPLRLAPCYDAAALFPLANLLSVSTGRVATEKAPPGDGVDGSGSSEGDEEGPMSQPPRTRIRVLDLPEGFAIDVRPAGLLRGSRGLFGFAILWLGMCGLILDRLLPGNAPAPIGLIPVALVMAGAGIAMLLVSLHMGRTRVMIAVNDTVVGIRRLGPFGRRERTFYRSDLTAVRCGPSGIRVNGRELMELQFHIRGGRKIGLLSFLSEDELRWLAHELRRRIGVGADPDGGGAA